MSNSSFWLFGLLEFHKLWILQSHLGEYGTGAQQPAHGRIILKNPQEGAGVTGVQCLPDFSRIVNAFFKSLMPPSLQKLSVITLFDLNPI